MKKQRRKNKIKDEKVKNNDNAYNTISKKDYKDKYPECRRVKKKSLQ